MIKTLITNTIAIPTEYAERFTNIEIENMISKIIKYGIYYEIGISQDEIDVTSFEHDQEGY